MILGPPARLIKFNSTIALTINKLESTNYYQKSWSIDNYLDEFIELIAEAGYTDPKAVRATVGLNLINLAGGPKINILLIK